jgi:uncharacterized protein with HEPN domain
MPRHDPRVRLLHMREYAQKAVAMAQGQTREDLAKDEKLRLALTRLVELVGEAATHVPAEIQQQHPEIPWPKVIGMRHRLIHGYDFVDDDVLWDTITGSLPGLVDALDRCLGEQSGNTPGTP